jgi:hypothetical protein
MKVTISKHWHNPEIHHNVNLDGIEMTITLEHFIEAVAAEIGPVTWVFRDATFRAKYDNAVKTVISKIKEESAKVV